MIEIKNTKVYGLEESIIRSGYPMQIGEPEDLSEHYIQRQMFPSTTNANRVSKLADTPIGSGHNNFLKGIIIQFDLRYPEYFSPQLQRYHWIDIVSSQSKMHKLTSRKLTVDDFTQNVDRTIIDIINNLISEYNNVPTQTVFNQIISNLPSGYLKWMGISTNYLQLKTIYNQRKHHKLSEWKKFCEWIETLPMSELIIGSNE